VFSIGSAGSVGSVLSAGARSSALSAGTTGSVLGSPTRAPVNWMTAVILIVAAILIGWRRQA
jgi:hypothetical protein